MPSENGEPLSISLMPIEIILIIARDLPPSSRASLALTCKGFWNAMPRRPIWPLQDPRECLGIRKELPLNFQESAMSDPKLFQPGRWELLRLLERDLGDKWLLCFDCFMLHPRHACVKPETPLVTWLKSCGGLRDYQSPPRSCRYRSRATPNEQASSFSLSGVVDLCPCVRLTPAKKDRICAHREAIIQNGYRGRKNHDGHSCVHIYNDIELKITLVPFFYEQDGGLGFRIQYHYKSPFDSSSICPRLTCPHISLDALIKTLSQCRELHPEHIVCIRCIGFQCCQECHTTVFGFSKDTKSVSGMITYTVNLERRFDEEFWNKHVVFPFARQRQYESMRTKPWWKLW